MYFSRGANVTVNADEVPGHPQHLIPLVEMWAIAGGGPQLLFIEHVRRHAPGNIETFVNTVRPALDDIRAWILASIEADGVRGVSDAVSHFSYTLSSYELAKPTDPGLLARGDRKRLALLAAKALQRALQEAGDAMHKKRYADVVELLEPYESKLTGANLKKPEIARKRAPT